LRTRWFKRPEGARPKSFARRLGRLAKLLYARVVRVNASPHRVASGVAVGVWLGVFPTFGLAGPLAYLLAWVFRFNKAGAVAGAAVMNPLTSPFFWALSAMVGAAFTGTGWREIYGRIRDESYVWALSRTTFLYFVGNLAVATATAALAYGAAFVAVRAREKRRRARREAAAVAPLEPPRAP
jgi:uncharacterized protein (DUF2062 family)